MRPHRIHSAALLAASLIALSSYAQVQTFPNTVKYKDSGIKPASARAGSAAIEARALINKDNSGDVEITTGSFDGGAPAGQVASMQIKLGTSGSPATTNYTGLDNSTAAVHLAELFLHEAVGVQANVRDVDGSRTDVVSATATAQLRPDLAVVTVSAPPHALVNAPATVSATISERNGDTGARATCRLLADGTEVDRAENIWVDAGGTVDCVFRHVFTNTGTVSLQVVVDTVSPGDWDDSNNASDAQSMRVYDSGEDFYVTNAQAVWRHHTEWQHNQSAQYDTHYEADTTTQQTTLYAWTREPIDLQTARMSISAQTDGRTLYDSQDVTFPEGFRLIQWIGNTCGEGYAGDAQISLCALYNGTAQIEVRESSSDIVYHSWGYDYTDNGWTPPPGVYDYVGARKGILQPFGTSVQWDIALSDANHFWHDQPFLASLTPFTQSYDRPWECYQSSRYGEVCGEHHSHDEVRAGLTVEQH